MRRRPARLLSAALLLVGLLLPGTAALAAPAAATEVVVLAAAGGEGDEPQGLDPVPLEDDEFAPTDYEANFLWGAAVGLLVLVLGIVGVVGAAYWFLVAKPRQPERQRG